MAAIRKKARSTILQNYDLEKCLKEQLKLIDSLVGGKRPTPGSKPGKPVFRMPAGSKAGRPAAKKSAAKKTTAKSGKAASKSTGSRAKTRKGKAKKAPAAKSSGSKSARR